MIIISDSRLSPATQWCIKGGNSIGTLIDESNGIRVESLEVLSSIANQVTYAIDIGSGSKGVYFDNAQLENYATAGILFDSTSAAHETHSIMFNHLYTEIPDNAVLIQFTDTGSNPLKINKLVIDSSYMSDLETASRATIANMTLTEHDDSFARVDISNSEFNSVNTVTPSTAVFDISSKVRMRGAIDFPPNL